MEKNIQQSPGSYEAQAWPEGTPRPMMTFIEAVKTCFSKYAVFSGRARRSEYWWFTLFCVICMIVCFLPFLALVGVEKAVDAGEGTASTIVLGILGLVMLLILIPSIAVQVRRLHDIGRSGWWLGWSYLASIAVAIVTMSIFGLDKAFEMDEMDTISQAFSVSWIPGLITLLLSIAEWALNIAIFIFSLIDSNKGENRYGLSPKYQ